MVDIRLPLCYDPLDPLHTERMWLPMPNPASKLTTLDMVYIALFAVLIAICAWISIPSTVPFTLQTFAVLCTMGLHRGKTEGLTRRKRWCG